jgi:hypothetical protein
VHSTGYPYFEGHASLRDLRILLIGKWTRPYGQEALVVTVEAEIAAISVIL